MKTLILILLTSLSLNLSGEVDPETQKIVDQKVKQIPTDPKITRYQECLDSYISKCKGIEAKFAKECRKSAWNSLPNDCRSLMKTQNKSQVRTASSCMEVYKICPVNVNKLDDLSVLEDFKACVVKNSHKLSDKCKSAAKNAVSD